MAAACKRIVVVTDSITVNAIWYRCSADYFLVANEQTAQVMRTAGVDRGKNQNARLSSEREVRRA